MSNVLRFTAGVTFYQVEDTYIRLIPVLSESAKDLLQFLYHLAQRRSRLSFPLTAEQIQEAIKLSPRSTYSARAELVEHKLIQASRGQGGVYRYILCDPKSGEPLRDPRANKGAKPTPRHTGQSLRHLKPEQYRRYLVKRLGIETESANPTVVCPLHTDGNASLSVYPERGLWNCHAGCGKGGILAFEMAFSKCDKLKAIQNIEGILGTTLRHTNGLPSDSELEVAYPYYDEEGRILFYIRRYSGKRFRACRITKRGRVVPNLFGTRRVLYNLPSILNASMVVITEGEKDADRINSLNLRAVDGTPIVATTNPHGAGHWKEEFSQCLKDKRVAILCDSDSAGMEHGDAIRESITPFTLETRIFTFSEPGIKDTSDFLDRYPVTALIEKIGADWIIPPDVEPSFEPKGGQDMIARI